MVSNSLEQFLFDPVKSDDVLWLLSPSNEANKEANDKVQESFDRLSGQLPRKLIVIRASSDESQPFPPPLSHEQLRAIVIVLEEDVLEDDNFRHCVNWCNQYFREHNDIPLFVCSTSLSRQKILKLGNDEDPIPEEDDEDPIHTLVKTVQIPDLPIPEHLSHFLKVYLSVNSSEQSLSAQATTLLGRLGSLILLCCATATGIAACAMLIFGKGSIIAHWIVANSIATAIIAGITISFLLSICVVLLRSIRVGSLLQAMSRGWGRMILFSFAGPTTFLLFLQIHVLPSNVVLGIVIGILLEITRHNGYLARRASLSLDKIKKESDALHKKHSEKELKQTQARIKDTLFEYPFFPIIPPPALSSPVNRQTRREIPACSSYCLPHLLLLLRVSWSSQSRIL